MDMLEQEWASSRIVGDPYTSIIDLPLVQVLNGTLQLYITHANSRAAIFIRVCFNMRQCIIRQFSQPSAKEKKLVYFNHGTLTTSAISQNEWKYAAEMETVATRH
jgi:hypothetical protein